MPRVCALLSRQSLILQPVELVSAGWDGNDYRTGRAARDIAPARGVSQACIFLQQKPGRRPRECELISGATHSEARPQNHALRDFARVQYPTIDLDIVQGPTEPPPITIV